MVDHEQRVREAAYFLWQAEGCPEGRAEMHWSMAEIGIVLLNYLSQGSGVLPVPTANSNCWLAGANRMIFAADDGCQPIDLVCGDWVVPVSGIAGS